MDLCGKAKIVLSVSYHKEQNNKAWPLLLPYAGRRVPAAVFSPPAAVSAEPQTAP